jgi:hypothetical protein
MKLMSTASSPSNPFETARLALIKRLLEMKAPKDYPIYPRNGDHQTIADHIRDAANIFDEWLYAIGREVADNSTNSVDMRLFTAAFLGAVDGNATYETETAGLQHGREAA